MGCGASAQRAAAGRADAEGMPGPKAAWGGQGRAPGTLLTGEMRQKRTEQEPGRAQQSGSEEAQALAGERVEQDLLLREVSDLELSELPAVCRQLETRKSADDAPEEAEDTDGSRSKRAEQREVSTPERGEEEELPEEPVAHEPYDELEVVAELQDPAEGRSVSTIVTLVNHRADSAELQPDSGPGQRQQQHEGHGSPTHRDEQLHCSAPQLEKGDAANPALASRDESFVELPAEAMDDLPICDLP
eukprot:gb/GFBE01029948.1/.p1 GENE.gb/GFBE01029948.1/~~gb/GFBE01029948.1/.p1  ORF type:complete len:246 (+),score=58.22 gb/GFBE01029948.1/:1-738(+)